MKPSKECLDLIKHFEGYHKALANGDCQAYPDPGTGGKPWTIGWGTTKYNVIDKYKRSEVMPGDTLTREQAELELVAEINRVANTIASWSVPLSQSQFDSAVSFAYNTGLYNRNMQRLKAGDLKGFRKALPLYVKGGNGKRLGGLVRRRKAEAELWDRGGSTVTKDYASLKLSGGEYSGAWAGLRKMQLTIGDDYFEVASGVAQRQIFRKADDKNSIPGSLEPIPQGVYHFGFIEWAAGKDNYSGSWGQAFGPVWQDLKNGQPMRRGAFGIHLDANLPWAPGSAGCVVFRTKEELKRYVESFYRNKHIKKLIVDWGL